MNVKEAHTAPHTLLPPFSSCALQRTAEMSASSSSSGRGGGGGGACRWPAASVLHGLCGWTDESLAKSSFFPAGCKDSLDRLRHVSRIMPWEVDTSTYAIPTKENTKKWADVTPPGFTFHVKAFGIFCHTNVPVNSLPRAIRELPCMQPHAGVARVGLEALPAAAVDALWRSFHASLEPLAAAGKLGLVIFQFQSSFAPSPTNRALIAACRDRLDAQLLMAVEFRNRAWFDEAHLPMTLDFLRAPGAADGGAMLAVAVAAAVAAVAAAVWCLLRPMILRTSSLSRIVSDRTRRRRGEAAADCQPHHLAPRSTCACTGARVQRTLNEAEMRASRAPAAKRAARRWAARTGALPLGERLGGPTHSLAQALASMLCEAAAGDTAQLTGGGPAPVGPGQAHKSNAGSVAEDTGVLGGGGGDGWTSPRENALHMAEAAARGGAEIELTSSLPHSRTRAL